MSGTMNPDDASDSDDSDADEDQDNSDTMAAASTTQAITPEGLVAGSASDDEDELEIDPAVVSSIQRTTAKRLDGDEGSKGLTFSKSELANGGSSETGTVEVEIRVATAVESDFAELQLSGKKPMLTKTEHESNAVKPMKAKDAPSEDVFGISYHSAKRSAMPADANGEDTTNEYKLATGPSFPDEKEYEKEVQIVSDASLSARASDALQTDQADRVEEDEFAFDEPTAARSSTSFSAKEIQARRASLEAQKVRQEEELLRELKHATDTEKKMIEHGTATGGNAATATPIVDGQTSNEMETVSLGELHSMYKRGLGDQSVHFLDDKSDSASPTSTGTRNQLEAVKPAAGSEHMSVMGRILSKPRGLSGAIAEEENEDDEDEDSGDRHGDDGDIDMDDPMSLSQGAEIGTLPDQQTHMDDYSDVRDGHDDMQTNGEWKEIQLIERPSVLSVGVGGHDVGDSNVTASPSEPSRISYTECAGYFAEAPLFLEQHDKIVPEEFPQRGSCLSCLSRPRLTFTGAIDERDRVFCIAATPFDPDNDVFYKILQTVYATLVPSTHRDVSLIGGHWEAIGFQGTDPTTDLRGCGVLSLLQILYLVENYGELARRLHSLSQHSTRHFPLACALINVTLQCLVALRSGALYPECNKHSSVFAGINMVRLSEMHDSHALRDIH